MFLRSIVVMVLGVGLLPSVVGQSSPGTMDASHEKDMAKIHALLGDSTKVRRTSKEIPGGIAATTESSDPKIVKLIQEHTFAMQLRLKAGKPIRDWDPLFAELFKQHSKVKLDVTKLPHGVSIKETSDDARVVALIREHAKAVNGFVKEGMAGMHKAHPLPASVQVSKVNFLGREDGIKTCPVTGEPVSKDVSAVIKGKTIYFCCPGCIETVVKNPTVYLKVH